MTMPDERTRALYMTKRFLRRLLIEQRAVPRTKAVWDSIRREASSCWRHYPFDFDIERVTKCKSCSKVFGELKQPKTKGYGEL